MIKRFKKNESGADFVVGDIHGCFSLLSQALSDINFNPKTDRLFAVGDLVDRGEQSADVVKWINKTWFHSVRGNHEQMAIDFFNGALDSYLYQRNGGQWFIDSSDDEQRCYVDLFSQLPYVIEIETDNDLVGVVHADCLVNDWQEIEGRLKNDTSSIFRDGLMWERSRINRNETTVVKNVSKVYVGHTPVNEPKTLGNCTFIDTGAVFTGKITVLRIN
jgi:serine/threonine protein phosphatase 1